MWTWAQSRVGTLNGFLVLLVLFQVVQLWMPIVIPSVDGPAHVHLSHAWAEYGKEPIYQEYFRLNDWIAPNYLAYLLLYAFNTVLNPIEAERLLVALYAVLFPATFYWTVSRVSPAPAFFTIFALPLTFNFAMGFGFYNFSFGMVIVIAWLGYWLRFRKNFSAATVLGHALFAALAYLCHLFALGMGLFAIGLASLGVGVHAALRKRPGGFRELVAHFGQHFAIPAIGALVMVIGAAAYLTGPKAGQVMSGLASFGLPDTDRLMFLVTGMSLVTVFPAQLPYSIAYVLSLAVLAFMIMRNRATFSSPANSFQRTIQPLKWALLLLFTGTLLLYLTVPFQFIVRWMPERILSYVFLTGLLALAAWYRHEAVARSILKYRVLALTGIALTIAFGVERVSADQQLNKYYRELFAGVETICEGSTLVALRLQRDPSLGPQGEPYPLLLDVFIQTGSYLATLRNGVDLKNFQAQTDVVPVRAKADISAYAGLASGAMFTAVPPRINVERYRRRTGKDVDYIVLWGAEEEIEDRNALQVLTAQLDEHYELIHTSEPYGLKRIYRSKASAWNSGDCPEALPDSAAASVPDTSGHN